MRALLPFDTVRLCYDLEKEKLYDKMEKKRRFEKNWNDFDFM